MSEVYLSLGSNIENREEHLYTALRMLATDKLTVLHAISSVYETDPVGYTEQAAFLNLACRITTSRSPHDLLDLLHEIENTLHRTREIHWGPRTIDIDILTYDDCIMNEPDLVLPHPRMYERGFVLVPLQEIYPSLDLPANMHDGVRFFASAPEIPRNEC
ncbi:MAG TPA: 2-amino-4-hydroxy-6-hydroxymethyldihydropteridine diphosphokinase [Bacillota bacterium]|mgnify:CR=1 FL=1|nr:2-amino-4-hydroxy-6-hydroxymethyldihydropteridine diphosphokinase [Bacillota bacterium]